MPVAFPDDVVGRVTDLMIAADLGRIAVVDLESRKLVGLIARKDILRLRSTSLTLESERRAVIGSPARIGRATRAATIASKPR